MIVKAVTICPVADLSEDKLQSVLDSLKPPNRTKFTRFLKSLFKANYWTFDLVENDAYLHPNSYMSTLLKLHGNFKAEVTVSGQGLNPKEWIHQVVTELGVCYSFNSYLALPLSLK